MSSNACEAEKWKDVSRLDGDTEKRGGKSHSRSFTNNEEARDRYKVRNKSDGINRKVRWGKLIYDV